MPLDSESRWRLVRRNKQKPATAEVGEVTIRRVTVEDLVQISEIYN